MKKCKISTCLIAAFLLLGIGSGVNAQSVNNEKAESQGAGLESHSAHYNRTDQFREGVWMWGMSAEQRLLSGSTAVAVDAGESSTIYVGGLGGIVVSNDSGSSWSEGLTFSASGMGSDADDNADNEDLSVKSGEQGDMQANRLREYLRHEIETQLGSSDLADSLLEEITDDELLDAKDINELESIAALNLDIESDLTQIPLLMMEQGDGVALSDYDPFITRFLAMRGAGADTDQAISAAARCSAVWSFRSTPDVTYAVTSEAIYLTIDKGQNWQLFMSAPEDQSILSLDISADGQIVVMGLTSGITMTRDGGENWVTIDAGIDGAFYAVRYVESDKALWGLSTNRLYHSSDLGLTWQEVDTRMSPNEVILDLLPGSGGQSIVLTTETIYQGEQNRDQFVFTEIPHKPFADETINQIFSSDPSLNRFGVRTNGHVFEYDNGWVGQNKALFTTDLGPVAILNDGVSMAIMATSAGVWFAQDSSAVEASQEYQDLKKKWAKEPTDAEVILKAFEAHYIGDNLDKNWALRDGLAWLLPTVMFNYFYEQYRQDKRAIKIDDIAKMLKSDTWTSMRRTTSYWEIMARWTFQVDTVMREDISTSYQLQQLKKERLRLMTKVQKELNKRHALQMTLALDFPKFPDKSSKKGGNKVPKRKLKVILSLDEVESNLNYLTGGYYLPAIYGNADPTAKYANY